MQHLYIITLIFFFFSACGNQEQKSTNEAQNIQSSTPKRDALLHELKAKEIALEKARLEAKVAKEQLLAQRYAKKEAFIKKTQEEQQKNEHEKLSKIGITIEENKIIIDTNTTKDFFQNIGKSINSKLKKITQDLEEGSIREQDAGIKIDKTHINIDLNQSKKFLEGWAKKMQGFVKEFDTIAKQVDTEVEKIDNTTIKGN